VKTILMASAAVLAALPAYAQPYQPPYPQPNQQYQPLMPPNPNQPLPQQPSDMINLGQSGYWSALQFTSGTGSCVAGTTLANGGMITLGVNGTYQRLGIAFTRNEWNIPSSVTPTATMEIDQFPPITGGQGVVFAHNSLTFTIAPDFTKEFVHELTSGRYLTVRFQGNEPPWTIPLDGTTGIWATYMRCADGVAPNFVATLNQGQPQPYAGTQPYNTPSSQPYLPSAPAPQPYNPPQPSNVSQPVVVPMAQVDGTFTVPATIGGRTALTFILDTGASSVVIPADIAAELERDGMLTETGVTGTAVLANGHKFVSKGAILNSVTVGGVTINDVECEIAPKGSSLLLGQTWMRKFKSVAIDYASNSLNIRV